MRRNNNVWRPKRAPWIICFKIEIIPDRPLTMVLSWQGPGLGQLNQKARYHNNQLQPLTIRMEWFWYKCNIMIFETPHCHDIFHYCYSLVMKDWNWHMNICLGGGQDDELGLQLRRGRLLHFNEFILRMMLTPTDRRIQNLKLTTGSLVASSAGELGASLFIFLQQRIFSSPSIIYRHHFIVWSFKANRSTGATYAIQRTQCTIYCQSPPLVITNMC